MGWMAMNNLHSVKTDSTKNCDCILLVPHLAYVIIIVRPLVADHLCSVQITKVKQDS